MRDTTISYNGIIIQNVLTNSIDQTVQLDSTGTDPIYVRTVASFTGIVHTSYTPGGGGGPNTIGYDAGVFGTGAEAIGKAYEYIMIMLTQPRRQFIMSIGPTVVFNVIPGFERIPAQVNSDQFEAVNTDANHGPIPSLKVLSIVSSNTIRIQFNVTLHIPWCDTPGNLPHGISSFRFWIGEDIDCADWTTTRTYHGKVRVRHMGHNVLLEFKQYFWCPALQVGFTRRSIRLQQSSNGLELDFTVEDKEVWAVAPPPATKWSGTHTMSAGVYMATLESNMSVELQGPKTVAKGELMSLVWRILVKKLHIKNLQRSNTDFVKNAKWVDHLSDNHVAASATVQHIAAGVPGMDFCQPLDSLSDPFGSPYNPEVAANAWPTATLAGTFLAYLNDPWHIGGWPGGAVMVAVSKNTAPPSKPPGTPPYVSPGSMNTSGLSPSHTNVSMYTQYQMTSDLDIDRGAIVLPYSKTSATAGGSSAALSMHNGLATRTVLIEAERIGSWPALPAPTNFTDSNGIVHTLLSDHPHNSAPQISADFEKTLYHTQYVLRYGLSRIPDYNKGEYGAGLLPYRDKKDVILSIPAGAFVEPKSILG